MHAEPGTGAGKLRPPSSILGKINISLSQQLIFSLLIKFGNRVFQSSVLVFTFLTPSFAELLGVVHFYYPSQSET